MTIRLVPSECTDGLIADLEIDVRLTWWLRDGYTVVHLQAPELERGRAVEAAALICPMLALLHGCARDETEGRLVRLAEFDAGDELTSGSSLRA